jgi:hypothetical protein
MRVLRHTTALILVTVHTAKTMLPNEKVDVIEHYSSSRVPGEYVVPWKRLAQRKPAAQFAT